MNAALCGFAPGTVANAAPSTLREDPSIVAV